jgi:methyltransferase family protein
VDQGKLNAYVRHGHHLVKGWLVPGAAEAIISLSKEQRGLGLPGGVAEIGVHHGKLFILLYLLGSSDESAVAIDIFSKQQLNVDHSGAGDLAAFQRNLRRHADTDRLVIHEGGSTELTSAELLELGRGPFRMISIDGGHTAEITEHDLATSEGALTRGGIILLDDCFNEMWPGVMEGVHQYFSQPRAIVPFGLGANKTFFCHQEFALQYAEILKKINGRIARQEFLGHPVICVEYVPRTFAGWYRKADPWRAVRRSYHDVLSRLTQ